MVRIVVDSSTCLDPNEAAKIGIDVVPLIVIMDGKAYRDFLDLTPTEFYRILRTNDVQATTSAPSVGDYLRYFNQANSDIVCLTVANTITSMYQAAVSAANLFMESRNGAKPEIYVVDTKTAAGGLRLLALEAAKVAAQGKSAKDIVERVNQLIPKIRMFGALETVSFLARSGRIPQVASWGTSLLRVRPVVSFRDGKGQLLQLARSADGMVKALVSQVDANMKSERKKLRRQPDLHATVFHADEVKLAQKLIDIILSKYPHADVSISEFTPVMGAHTGPGVLGLAFFIE